MAIGAALVSMALAVEAAAPAPWLIAAGSAVFSAGFGAIDAALNVYAAANFEPKAITWMHASYGLGATLGLSLFTALLAAGANWRAALGLTAAVIAVIAAVLAAARRAWNVTPPPARPPDRSALRLIASSPRLSCPLCCPLRWRPGSSRRPAFADMPSVASAKMPWFLLVSVGPEFPAPGADVPQPALP